MSENKVEQERFEVEILEPQKETRYEFSDVDEAAIFFYQKIAENYHEPSYELGLHDLVAGKTLAIWNWNPDDEMGRVLYDVKTPVLGN